MRKGLKVRPVRAPGQRRGGQCAQVWLTVKGTAKWKFKLEGTLPPGRYVVYARAIDGKGAAETSFSRKLRNRYAFRVLAPKPR